MAAVKRIVTLFSENKTVGANAKMWGGKGSLSHATFACQLPSSRLLRVAVAPLRLLPWLLQEPSIIS